MLSVSSLSLHFGGRTLFDDIAFQVNPTDRIGLVGRNGSGKSTLLKILAGHQQPDNGSINIPKTYTIGYLPQEIQVKSNETIFKEASKAFEELLKLNEELHQLDEAITSHTDFESDDFANLVERLTDVSHRVEVLGGATMEKQVEQVLTGLGFVQEDLDRPMQEFSGGWQMRVELAKILLAKPDLLLLDEPTNHLDIESIMWLENFLLNYPGSVMLVSHDKALLNNMTNRTIEIEAGSIYDYKANYDKYLELRSQRREKLISEKKNQDKYIEHTEQLINKFRAKKNKAAFAQSLIKKLDKMERVELDDEDNSAIKFRFPEPPRSGKVVLNIEHLSKKYDDHQVLKNIGLSIEKGEKIAFVGKNGEGKTTLSKIIAGKEPYEGKMELGHNVSIGYFAQHQAEMLQDNITVFDTIDQAATGEMRTRVRALLGAFLFSGDDVHKKVKVLSGGEKGRLAMAKLLLEPVNLLILDEPTNHLDMRAKEILKYAIEQFAGTVILVSHDREFLAGLTKKVYEFKDQKIKEYLGDINYFLSKKNLDNLQQLELKSNIKKGKETPEPAEVKSNKDAFEEKKQFEKEERKLRNDIQRAEGEIEMLEKKIAENDKILADPSFYEKEDDSDAFYVKYNELKEKLKNQMDNWEKLNAELEELISSKA